MNLSVGGNAFFPLNEYSVKLDLNKTYVVLFEAISNGRKLQDFQMFPYEV